MVGLVKCVCDILDFSKQKLWPLYAANKIFSTVKTTKTLQEGPKYAKVCKSRFKPVFCFSGTGMSLLYQEWNEYLFVLSMTRTQLDDSFVKSYYSCNITKTTGKL